eukprot:TRINITY_DN1316_c0_g1_i4.p1 TRINITY_DN1316_c0_g1~~TRINITY_DN1316_c0_g1_i4.p1  ORF type:complete len:243 (+),score=37.22 TRINITY_DN1316_c0_g1_i4:73-801(+)
MGGVCTRSTGNDPVVSPQDDNPGSPQDAFAALLSLDHPHNINHKFSNFCIVIRDKYVGSGIRKTYAYKTTLGKESLEQRREEYWETRVEGNEVAWSALRLACELDDGSEMTILANVGLRLVANTLQMAYDSRGYRYDVPIFCINDPIAFEDKKKTVDIDAIEDKVLRFKLRSMTLTADIVCEVENKANVRELKEFFLLEAKLTNLTTANVRIFYNGTELQDHRVLAEYNILDGMVLTVFIRR